MSPDEFTAWADSTIRLATDAGRKEVAEIHFGALLARMARKRPWDDWLPNVILEYLDRPECAGLRERFCMGVRNARGVKRAAPTMAESKSADLPSVIDPWLLDMTILTPACRKA